MSAFTVSSFGVASFGSPPAIDSFTKSIDSTTNNNTNHLGEIQNFLLGSDWSALSSLSPPTVPVNAVVDNSTSWSPSVADAPLFPSSIETTKLNMQTIPATVVAAVSEPGELSSAASDTAFDSAMSASSPVATPPTAAYPSPLTPVHRHSFDTCYTDSVGSPDSDRDFLVSPSMFDDASFEFEGDALANTFPLFTDQACEDFNDPIVEESVSVTASNLENVKLEVDHEPESESQQPEIDIEASQSTVMPSQSQQSVVKVEEQDDHESFSTLAAAFKTEDKPAKLELKHEQDLWSEEELKPYFSDDESKVALLSTLANALVYNISEPSKELPSSQDEQRASHIGPIRRDRRSSPSKVGNSHSSGSPVPFIDPITKAKRWQCGECGKLFDRAYNLKTHTYTHEDPLTRARPFICPDADCQKQFARKHDMQRHFENVHRGESRRAKTGFLKRSRADDLG